MSDDRDAFGRKQGEDGLGDLGWGSSGSMGSTSRPADPMASTPQPVEMPASRRETPVIVRLPGHATAPEAGSRVTLRPDLARSRLFDAAGQAVARRV